MESLTQGAERVSLASHGQMRVFVVTDVLSLLLPCL